MILQPRAAPPTYSWANSSCPIVIKFACATLLNSHVLSGRGPTFMEAGSYN